MPSSRKRRSRISGPDRIRRRQRERPPAPDEECLELTGPEIHAQFRALLTADDVAAFGEYVDAEAAGEPVLAAEALQRGLQVQGTCHLPHLAELIDLGDDAPAWALGRWASLQAYRWMMHEQDPRVAGAVLTTTLACFLEADLERPMGLSILEFGKRLAAGDWITRQIAVYESDGLADFVDVKIGGALLDRCGPLAAWPEAELGGYRLRPGRHGFLDVRDFRDGRTRQVLDIGALTNRRPGCTVLGRLVPIDVEPGYFFESRPIGVDDETALGVARSDGPEDWLGVLEDGREAGRLPLYFSSDESTPLTSDIVPEGGWGGTCSHEHDPTPSWRAQAPGLVELEARGLDPLRANNIAVCDVALMAVELSPAAVATVAKHVQAVLIDRQTFEAAQVHRTRPEDAAGWALLATAVPEPVRSRCLELAAQSGRRGRRAPTGAEGARGRG